MSAKKKARIKLNKVKLAKAVLPDENALSETDKVKKIKIKVVGVGDGGGSIVSSIVQGLKKASFLIANTDGKALKKSAKNVEHFQFGSGITFGAGTGMKPELGERAAQEAKEKIKKFLKDADLCIFVATLGGGTGSGAAPVFAQISKELGNINYGIFTLPFGFEGVKKMEIAKNSLNNLRQNMNALSVIENERIFQLVDRKIPLKAALSQLNKTLTEGLEGLIEIIYEPGIINIDFADVRTIFKGGGKLAYLNSTEAGGENRAKEAIARVLSSPLYSYNASGARGVLFNVAGDKNLGLAETAEISKSIHQQADRGAKIIFGVSENRGHLGRIKVTLLATGCHAGFFLEEPTPRANPVSPRRLHRVKKKSKVRRVEIREEAQAPAAEAGNVPPARKNALQVRKEAEEVEKELLQKENFWETPPFLRQKNPQQ